MENYKDRKFYPENLPYFSSMVIDSDGNLLVLNLQKRKIKPATNSGLTLMI